MPCGHYEKSDFHFLSSTDLIANCQNGYQYKTKNFLLNSAHEKRECGWVSVPH